MRKTPELRTERLYLRPVKKDDTDEIFDCWMQDEDVSRYMYWKASNNKCDAQEFVIYELAEIDNKKWYRWIIENDNKIIGTCLIYFNEDEENWDISYNLGKKYWGKGYITEAMHCVLDFAVKTIGIRECIAVHAVENQESGRVIEKLGFRYEKEVPYECNGGEIKTTGRYYRLIVREKQ